MGTNTLIPKVATATLASAHVGNRNLSTDPKRMAVIKVWDAMMRGARKYCEQEDFEWYLGFHEEHDVKLHSGAGVGMARVAQFILGQTDFRKCIPFLINRDNVI